MLTEDLSVNSYVTIGAMTHCQVFYSRTQQLELPYLKTCLSPFTKVCCSHCCSWLHTPDLVTECSIFSLMLTRHKWHTALYNKLAAASCHPAETLWFSCSMMTEGPLQCESESFMLLVIETENKLRKDSHDLLFLHCSGAWKKKHH